MNRIHLVVALLLATGGCKRAGGADSMALVPKESTIVFSVNVDRLRGSKTWAQIKNAANDPSNKKDYDEFVQKTGLDPLTQINGFAGGFSGPDGSKGQFAVVVRGKFDEPKLIAYAKEKAKEDGKTGELKMEQYGGKTIYGESDDAGVSFLDSQTMVIGGRDWVHKVIDVAAGKQESVKKNEAVQALIGKAHTDQVMWAVGQVPTGQGQLSAGGEFKSIVFSVDLQEGMKGEIAGQASSADDAKKMAADLKKKIADSKTDPQVSMALTMSGLGPLLETVKIDPEDAWVKVTASMTQPQLDELVNRIKGMMQMMKGMGGMGGMPGPGGMTPPGATPELPAPTPLAPPEAPKRKKK